MLTINDILDKIGFGDLNPLKDTNTLYVDQRRSTSISTMNEALRKYYDRNCLTNRSEFYGIVVDVIERTQPSHCNKNTWTQTGDSPNGAVGLYTVYNVYMPEMECRPEPLSYNDPVIATYKEICVSNDLAMSVAKGSIVKVAYGDPLNFAQPEIVAVEGGIDASSIPAFREGLSSTYAAASTTNLVGESCVMASNEIDTKRKSFTVTEMTVIGPGVASLFAFIAGRESGHGDKAYEAVNRGKSGDTKGGTTRGTEQNLGRLQDMSMGDLADYSRGGSRAGEAGKSTKGDGVGLWAVGKYQVIPKTLRSAKKALKISSGTKFNKATQEAIGGYLVLMKRPALGNYLMGFHDDVCSAGQALAKEWSSNPLQYDELDTSSKNKTGLKSPRGSSFYVMRKAEPERSNRLPGGKNAMKRTPEEVTAMLQKTRQELMANSAAMEIIRKKGSRGGRSGTKPGQGEEVNS